MRSWITTFMAVLGLATLLLVGCSQPQPATPPQPTTAPAQPAAAATTAPAQPTAAPAQPTAAPAKVNFPEKGKSITVIVPYPAGGGVDVAARLIAPLMEKDLGTPVMVENKAGAGAQLGLTSLAQAKPDGYTIGYTILPTTAITYLDKARQATYNRKSFQPIANQFKQPIAILVRPDSPYKTIKDLVDAAKASPNTLSHGTTGLGSTTHMAALQLQKAAGITLRAVHFDGDAPQTTALMGGHVDVGFIPMAAVLSQAKSGQVRLLAIMDDEGTTAAPDVKTLAQQGYNVTSATVGGITAPAGTPQEIVSIFAASIKKAVADPQVTQKMQDLGYIVRYMDTGEYAAYWDTVDGQVGPLIDLMKAN
jgi:tripartite-type tricarboxylate transporter receptor subunit TctC